MSSNDTKWDIYLPTAGLIIGWLNIGVCTLESMYIALLIYEIANVDWRPGNGEVKMMAYRILGVYLVFIFVDFISSLLLIIGTYQYKSSLLLPWMILNAMSIAMKLMSNMYLLVMWLITLTPPLKNMGFFFFNLLYTAFHCWLWLLVYYLYEHIVNISRE